MASDIVLIHPNDKMAVYGDTQRYVACEPPFWCAVIASYCKKEKLSVVVIDAEAENLSYEQVVDRVLDCQPYLVGIIVTGTNLSASTQKMQGAQLTCEKIKSACASKIFLWGLHPSALPERTLEECKADYVVKGEGFAAVVDLVKGKKPERCKDLYVRQNKKYIFTGTDGLMETKDIPMPAWELLPMECYVPHNWHIMGENNPEDARGRYGVISTSIGCPFNCSYCAISAQFGERKVRFWDVDRVMKEIDRQVGEYNIKYIKILDECFVLNREYVELFCDKLIKRDYDLNLWAYARIDTVDKALLVKLRKAGIKWLCYGIESANRKVMKDVNKNQYGIDLTEQVIKWTKEADINVLANFMFGLPEDTEETMLDTLALAKKINPEWINFYVTMPYPGSKDYFRMLENGQIKNDKWIQYAQYSYECVPMGSKYLTPKEVLRFRDWAFINFFEQNEEYFELIRTKFGEKYVETIKEMTKSRLRRKLLEN